MDTRSIQCKLYFSAASQCGFARYEVARLFRDPRKLENHLDMEERSITGKRNACGQRILDHGSSQYCASLVELTGRLKWQGRCISSYSFRHITFVRKSIPARVAPLSKGLLNGLYSHRILKCRCSCILAFLYDL